LRILFISKDNYYDDVIRNNLKDISERDSIIIFHDYKDAEDFIDNNIIRHQMALDIVITENNIHYQDAKEFFQKIILDKIRTFSNRDFKFSSIPTILFTDPNENKNSFMGIGFDNVISDIGLNKLHLFKPDIINSVKAWRRRVLDELDNSGIRYNSGNIDFSYLLSKEKRRNISTNILSDNFILFPRKLDYEWLITNEKQIEIAIDNFIKELKRSKEYNKRNEKRFHKLFNKFPLLIKRDNYVKHWYELRLNYEENKYFEPDYSLLPNFNQQTDLSILEIKLPNEKFIKKTKFHPNLYGKIFDYITQVNDYKDYLESEKYFENIIKKFGFLSDKIEYNILIGREDDKNENFKLFNKRIEQIHATHINFITYDELLEYQVKYLERMNILKIH
jgi:hypothetical protein